MRTRTILLVALLASAAAGRLGAADPQYVKTGTERGRGPAPIPESFHVLVFSLK